MAETQRLREFRESQCRQIEAGTRRLLSGGGTRTMGHHQSYTARRMVAGWHCADARGSRLVGQSGRPANAFNVATKRPKTWLAGIPNCGHNMVFEQPDDVAEHIVAF